MKQSADGNILRFDNMYISVCVDLCVYNRAFPYVRTYVSVCERVCGGLIDQAEIGHTPTDIQKNIYSMHQYVYSDSLVLYQNDK